AVLFGCFYAGVIAVPCCPPRADLVEDGFAPLEGIVGDCDPAAILVGEPVADFMRDACAERPAFSQCSVLVTEMMADDTVDDFPSTKIRRDTLAILQYTSGSTGDPKRVMLDHGNILQNCYAIQTSLDLRTETEPPPGARWVAVSWLPHYHDMGLIGNIIQPVYVGGLSYRFSPTILLMRPLRWLEAISRYRAVTSGGPNFA